MKCQTNVLIVAFWQLVFIMISEFLIKRVVSHIAHDIRDRIELVTHCFSLYCDSKVWNFCCMWRSMSWYTSSWNFIKFCCLRWKLYTHKNLGGPLIMAHRVIDLDLACPSRPLLFCTLPLVCDETQQDLCADTQRYMQQSTCFKAYFVL